MANKFFVPAATMIAGILVWTAFIVLHETGDGMNERSLWPGAGLCLVTGALVVFSGHRCRQVQGPRMGNIVRTAILIVMAAITFWRAGIVTAAALALAAIATGVLALTDHGLPEAEEDSVSASAQAGDKTD